ncbi:MAG: hypothetical protein GY751_19735 [Bacteroidetes bacterium]|nr:hypothetical protein [Bacteroidota bacterium]
MKLIVAVGAIEFKEEIARIFAEAGISIYSQSRITGHNEPEEEALRSNWFAQSSDDQRSIVFFAFTAQKKAAKALELANIYNESISSQSRIKAFIMPVEDHN